MLRRTTRHGSAGRGTVGLAYYYAVRKTHTHTHARPAITRPRAPQQRPRRPPTRARPRGPPTAAVGRRRPRRRRPLHSRLLLSCRGSCPRHPLPLLPWPAPGARKWSETCAGCRWSIARRRRCCCRARSQPFCRRPRPRPRRRHAQRAGCGHGRSCWARPRARTSRRGKRRRCRARRRPC